MIHVVEAGRIVESGSHAQLLALNGRYVDVSEFSSDLVFVLV